MSRLNINIGTTANDRTGDPLRTAFEKVNQNFIELYSSVGADIQIPIQTGNNGKYLTTNGSTLSWNNVLGDYTIENNYLSAEEVTVFSTGGDVNIGSHIDMHLSVGANRKVNIINSGDIDAIPFSINPTTSTIEFPNGLTIVEGVIGRASTNTVTEEIPGGTISETVTQQSQIEIEPTGIVIAKRTIVTVDDGVTTSTDSAGSTLEVNNAGAVLKHYVEPDGPNNSAYFQLGTTDAGAVLEGISEDVDGGTYGRVTVTQDVIQIANGTANFDNSWVFEPTGTLTVSNMFPVTFTAVLDSNHMVNSVGLTDTPWQLNVQFQVNSTGSVQTMIDNIFPILTNPGYVSGYVFRFTEADHGIPDYQFDITLNNVVLPGGAGWTANLAVNPPPEYPITMQSTSALKLKSGINTAVVLQTSNETIGGSETATNSNPTPSNVFFGYLGFTPTIDNVQVGWTVTGDSLVGTKTVTAVALGGFENGYWTITVDGSDGSTFEYNETYTFTQENSITANQWTFSSTGVIQLPAGGDITDSTGTSVLGTPTVLDGGNASTTF